MKLSEFVLNKIAEYLADDVDYLPLCLNISSYPQEEIDELSTVIKRVGFKMELLEDAILEAQIEFDVKEAAKPYACRGCAGKNPELIIEKTVKAQEKNLRYRIARKCCVCGRDLVVAEMLNIIGPYIVVEPVAHDVRSKAGIIMPQTMWRVWRIGKVVRLGEKELYFSLRGGYRNSYHGDIPENVKGKWYQRPPLQIGDTVLFQNSAVLPINPGCNEYYLLHYDDVDLKLEDSNNIMPM